MSKRRSGFTLIEILIVVIILGILAAIVIPQFTNASEDAKLSAVQSTVQSVQGQIELYKLQHGDVIPNATWVLDSLVTASVYDGKTVGPYLGARPAHPFSQSTSVTLEKGATSDWSINSAGKFQGYAKGTWWPKD